MLINLYFFFRFIGLSCLGTVHWRWNVILRDRALFIFVTPSL